MRREIGRNGNQKKRAGRRKGNPGASRKQLLFLAGVAGIAVAAAVISSVFVFWGGSEKAAEETVAADTAADGGKTKSVQEEKIPSYVNPSVLEDILSAGKAVTDALDRRPPVMELPEEAADFASIESCGIGESGKVEISLEAPGLPRSDDKYYYLFEEETYDEGLSGDSEPLVREYKDRKVDFSVRLNYKQEDSRLFSKFVVAVKKEGEYIPVSEPKYINNPEAVAKYNYTFPTPASKKGLLVDPNKIHSSELDDLGVKHAAYNIPIARLIGQTTSGNHPTVYYTYNGKKYPFNGQVVAEYDFLFSTLTRKGITTTGIILNNMSGAYPELIHPLSRSGNTQSQYYAFNAADASGAEWFEAIGSFLAERYSGGDHGKVVNWVIGNEVNARKEWNYMKHVDLQTYTEEYARAFRIFYNAIKSVNANARVYISLDQQWDRNWSANPDYDGRDLLDEFNSLMKREGNIDWGLAQHPYSVPLTNVKFWNSSKYVKDSFETSMVTMDNVHVITDYLKQDQFLTDAGEVRPVILSELGYTSSAGEQLQAAAYVYAYYAVEKNPHIDAIILSRETDAGEEIAQGLALGLSHPDGSRKYIWNVFKYIDTEQSASYTEFAKGIIGINSWEEILN